VSRVHWKPGEPKLWGVNVKWSVGDRAKWLPGGRPSGGSWNPPGPGWSLPTKAEVEESARWCRRGACVVMKLDDAGLPSLVERDDGWQFDPRPCIALLVSASWPHDYHPNPKYGW
jgi:hypothetical protein